MTQVSVPSFNEGILREVLKAINSETVKAGEDFYLPFDSNTPPLKNLGYHRNTINYHLDHAHQ